MQLNNQNSNKSTDDLARGKRLKLVRQLANLTRKDMLIRYQLNPNTLQAWEKGVNSITETKADYLVKCFQQEGLNISKDWLLYGDSSEFAIGPLLSGANKLAEALKVQGDLAIFQEMQYFCSNNLNAITIIIPDDSMLPLFQMGDYVGGVAQDNELANLVGHFCIITLENDTILVRKIFRLQEDQSLIIGAINPLPSIGTPHCLSTKIKSAAKITRHWLIGGDG